MTVNLTPFPLSPSSLPSDLRFHRPTSSTPVASNSSSSSESNSSASSSGAVCSNSYSSVGMCCRGMEMLKVFEKRREMCEGDDRECEPSTMVSEAVSLQTAGATYIVSGRPWAPTVSSKT